MARMAFLLLLAGCRRNDAVPLDKSSPERLARQIWDGSAPGDRARRFAAVVGGRDRLDRFIRSYEAYLSNFDYVADRDDELTPAETLFAGARLAGDCEDFAVGLLALARVQGASARVILGDDGRGFGHVYAQVLVAATGEATAGVTRRLASYGTTASAFESDSRGMWLTLETFPPGAKAFHGEVHRLVVYGDGDWEELR